MFRNFYIQELLGNYRNCRKISDTDCAGYFFQCAGQKSRRCGVSSRIFDLCNRRNRQVKMCQLFSYSSIVHGKLLTAVFENEEERPAGNDWGEFKAGREIFTYYKF